MYLRLGNMKCWLKYFVLIFCLNFIEGSQSFRCDYKYSSAAQGWFKHFEVPANWFHARQRCALEGAVLASPTTPELKDEMTNITNSIETQQQYEVFTGIHDTISTGVYHTIEGTPLWKIPHTWAPNEPDNKDDKESCLTLNNNGELADIPCRETRPYICYRSASTEVTVKECGTIDPEYRLDSRTNKCYKLHTVPRNFSQAYLVCAAEGGHLAIINSDIEASVIGNVVQQQHGIFNGVDWPHLSFIGFHDWNEPEWRTIHGQTLAEAGYSKFEKDPKNSSPGQHCGTVLCNGELGVMYCDKLGPFVCEKRPEYDAACSLPDD